MRGRNKNLEEKISKKNCEGKVKNDFLSKNKLKK